MRWLRLNFHRKFLLILLTVGLLPAITGVALTARELWSVIRQVSGDNLLLEARNVAGLLDREITDFLDGAAATAAENPDVVDLFTLPDGIPATPTLTIAFSSLWRDAATSHAVLVLPKQGPIRTFVFPPGANAARPTDAGAYGFLEARRQTLVPGFKAITVHTDPRLHRPVAVAWVPVPPVSGEGFLGWVGLEISVDRILEREASRALFGVDEACVLTNMGHLLAALRFPPERAEQLQERLNAFAPGSEERFEIKFEDGAKRLVGFSPLRVTRALRRIGRSDADWFVCVGRDLQPLAAVFRSQLARNALGGTILAAFLTLAAYLFAHRLTRPIKQLEEGARRIASGDLESRVAVRTGDELEALAHAFNEMAEKLRDSRRDLQRQMDTVRKQAGELALLYEVTRAINSRLELDQILRTFARESARVLSYDRMSVALLDDDGKHFTVQFVFPDTEASEFAAGTRHQLDESDIGDAIRVGRPLVRRDIALKPRRRALDDFLARSGFRSVMVVPLVSESKAIGSVNFASRDPDAFGPEDQERVATLAASVAVAIEHSRLYARIRRFAEELEAEVRRRTAQLRAAQDKLVQTEKLAASGQLAAGIAHEINNPLGIIKNHLRLVGDSLRRSSSDGSLKTEMQYLEVIEDEINRIARIVRNLLDLYHPRDHSPAPTDINQLLERTLELFVPNWKKKGISLVRRMEPGLPQIVVSADRLRQVFINLLRNAEDAISGKGTVTVTTRLEPAAVESETPWLVIEVEDTGCGIAPEALNRVFDPFFTTKKGGTGTGLGLSVTYGIIRSHGGTIDIQSEPGRGTRVTVRLPVGVPKTASSADPAASGGGA